MSWSDVGELTLAKPYSDICTIGGVVIGLWIEMLLLYATRALSRLSDTMIIGYGLAKSYVLRRGGLQLVLLLVHFTSGQRCVSCLTTGHDWNVWSSRNIRIAGAKGRKKPLTVQSLLPKLGQRHCSRLCPYERAEALEKVMSSFPRAIVFHRLAHPF